MLVAIHQPNFFPWLGYFDKLRRCDRFVMLDTVQHQKKGGTWGNRVKLLVAGEPRWFTAAIDRSYHGVKPISEIRFDQRDPWREKLVKSLQASYARAPHFNEAMDLLLPLACNPDERLAQYNRHAIESIAKSIDINTDKIIAASDLLSEGSSNELLIALTRDVGGNAYMCGGGAEGYQQAELFAAAGIELRYQEFHHPLYPQQGVSGAFVPGLSIIDALMNVGIAGTGDLLAKVEEAEPAAISASFTGHRLPER